MAEKTNRSKLSGVVTTFSFDDSIITCRDFLIVDLLYPGGARVMYGISLLYNHSPGGNKIPGTQLPVGSG